MVPDRRDGDPGEPSLVELVFPHDVADGLPHIVESLLEILGGQIIGGQAGLGMGVLFTVISATGIRSWILRNLPHGWMS